MNLLVILFLSIFASISAEDTVTLKVGEISGKFLSTQHGRNILAFKRIPYAKPPIGELRFQRPQRAETWEGVLDGTQDGPMCPQLDYFTGQYLGAEDCLHLNVYTPKLPTRQENPKLPVMFWIHGGGYSIGTGNELLYGPTRLLDKDIVLVTINYRIGALGFLSTEDEIIAGNYGMFDQNLALKWVQENIEAFGGNPERVTIFGSSAGGASVSLHTLSPHSKGLFHAAILQSGTAACTGWATYSNPRNTAKLLAIKLGCPAYNSESIRKCMLSKKSEDIVAAQQTFSVFTFLPILFAPVVETFDGFLPSDPLELYDSGKVHQVPMMIGRTKDEGALDYPVISKMFDETSDEFWDEDMKIIIKLFINDFRGNVTETAKEIKKLFASNISLNDKRAAREAAKQLCDSIRFEPCLDLVIKSVRALGNPTFAYQLSYRGKHSFTELLGVEEDIGVCHGDDLQYLFDGEYFPHALTDKNDLAMSDLLVSLWTNFATFHDPTPSSASSPFKWLPTTSGVLNYLNITLNPEMVRRDFIYVKGNFLNRRLPKLQKNNGYKTEL